MFIFISIHDLICWFVWTVGTALNRKKRIVKTGTYHWGEHVIPTQKSENILQNTDRSWEKKKNKTDKNLVLQEKSISFWSLPSIKYILKKCWVFQFWKEHGKKAYGFACHELKELSPAQTLSWIFKADE